MSTSPTLWVGTNSGLVLVLSLSIPHLLESRQRDGVTAGNKIIQYNIRGEYSSIVFHINESFQEKFLLRFPQIFKRSVSSQTII